MYRVVNGIFQQILSKEKNGDAEKQGNAVRNKMTEKRRDRKPLQTEGLQNQSEKGNAHQVDDGRVAAESQSEQQNSGKKREFWMMCPGQIFKAVKRDGDDEDPG